MALAPQTYNPGGRGQNSRYDVRGLQRIGPNHLTDGQWIYDNDGRSVDRPDSVMAGLRPADQMDARNAWDPGVSSARRVPPGFPPGGRIGSVMPGLPRPTATGQLPPWGYEGQAPSAGDWTQREGFYDALEDPGQHPAPQGSPDALLQALAGLTARVPRRGGRLRMQ